MFFAELWIASLTLAMTGGAMPQPSVDFHYQVRHVLALSDDVIVAHIARLGSLPGGPPLPASFDPEQPFSEMAMYVLVRRNGQWWLAAGQNTPMRPGGAVPVGKK